MKIYYFGRNIDISVKKVGLFGKFIGLMFKTRKTRNLLFEFSHEGKFAIHSFFVFFSFLALWIDNKNRVLEWKIVRPFSTVIIPKKKFRKLIEVPLSRENSKIVKFFVGKRKV